MPRTPLHALTWFHDDGLYALSTRDHVEQRFRPTDEEAWQAWLRAVTSFAFHGASGSLNVYLEARARGGRYWYAYHTAGDRTRKCYLGRTVRVSFARLEEVACALAGGPGPAPHAPTQTEREAESGSRVALSNASREAEVPVTLPATKFAPPRLPIALVGRDRLLADLDVALSTPLTLLSASAGWGKTTLLAAWARKHPHQIAWLSLDALDKDLARFWIAVIVALRACVPNVGTTALAMLRSPQPPPITAVVTVLLNEFADAGEQGAPIVLLLDDYQLVGEQAIHESLLFYLEHLPASVHLLIASRVDPDLPLARLRARGQLTEIRAADLRFTREDVGIFLGQVLGFPLAEDEVLALERRTEGWVAGLQIAALSLRKQEDRLAWLANFAGSHRYLLDYVQDEILAPQSLTIRRFLLQVAVLTRMNAALCQAVTGEPASQEILEALERANLFVIPLDEQRQWYRLHDLFREALLAQMQASEPELLPHAHRRAAQWYAAHDEMPEAIAHALAANDYPLAASLIERAAPRLWLSGEAQTVHTWLRALPDDIFVRHARLVLDADLRLLESLHATADAPYSRARIHVEETLARVEDGLHGQEGPPLPEVEVALIRRRLRLLRALIEARTLLPRGDTALLSQFAEEIEALSEHEEVRWQMVWVSILFWRTLSIRREGARLIPRLLDVKRRAVQASEYLATIHAMLWLAFAYWQAGRLHLAERECQDALVYVRRLGVHTSMTGYLHLQLGDIYYAWNRLDRAADALEASLRVARTWQQSDLLLWGNVTLARVALAQGRPSAADQSLQEAEAVVQRERFMDDGPTVAAGRAWYWLATGDLARATHWWARTAFDPHAWVPRHAEALLTQVRMSLSRRQYPAAREALERFATQLDRPDDIPIAIEFLILDLVTLHHEGMSAQAREVAARLFAMTEPEGWLRAYLDAGAPMERALKAFLDAPDDETPGAPALPRAYISRLLTAFAQEKQDVRSPAPHGVAAASPALIEPLTRREREVLRHLTDGASNQEIAAALAISLTTVKKHVSNLLGKLGAQSRTQAIARARDASLL
jgi:LuxR family transcriptional regulator, maltose regulon positive regulatory protein